MPVPVCVLYALPGGVERGFSRHIRSNRTALPVQFLRPYPCPAPQPPSPLVPYSSYSLRFILLVLRDYFLHRACVQKICEHAGISVSTLYRWKALFLAHKALWLGMLEDLKASAEAFLDGMDGTLLQGFCRKFLFSFLQRLRSASPDPPSGAPGQPSGST